MNIRTAYITLTLTLSALLAAGCTNDAAIFAPSDEPVPIQIADVGITARIQTRATITSGSMGVFLSSANGYTPQYDVQYTYSSGWKPGSTTINVGGANATLHAYYPNTAATFAANSTICILNAQKWAEDKDLCYATTGGTSVCNKTPGVTFNMARAYARIKLSIQRRSGSYSGNCNITKVNLKSDNSFYITRTLDISNGTYEGTAVTGGWTYALTTGNIADGATNTAYDMLVPHQPVASGLTLTLTVDGTDRAVTVPASQLTSGNLNVGRQYTINLTITDTAVTITGNVSITDMVTDSSVIQNETPIDPK